jgi:hypothetical protein
VDDLATMLPELLDVRVCTLRTMVRLAGRFGLHLPESCELAAAEAACRAVEAIAWLEQSDDAVLARLAAEGHAPVIAAAVRPHVAALERELALTRGVLAAVAPTVTP